MSNSSVYAQVLAGIADKLQDESLEDIFRNVKVQDSPFDSGDIRPGAYVTPQGVREGDGTTERDLMGYLVLVTVVRGKKSGGTVDQDRWTMWRQKVIRCFNNKRIMAVDDTDCLDHGCKAWRHEWPKPVQDRIDKANMSAEAVMVSYWVLEPRT